MQNKHQNTGKNSLGNKWLLLAVLFAGAIFVVQQNALDFKASVIPTKSAQPYDGTTLPILKAPKWTSLTSAEYKASYEAIPAEKLQALPTYDASVLKTPAEQLGWKTEKDLAVRNAKITFSVPYMGNYKLDGVENAGSHLAVDIKVPDNTPVYAIGNGVVVKVAEQSSGFGRHIVVKHEGFPSLDDPTAKVTLYSSYNHLNEILVSEGDVVIKGQQIAKSGHSGLSTTPHLHFQIDNDKAPWHPYWPFTYQESNAAGLSFNDAIDAGLGKDKALLTTVNPMMYVQKYISTTMPVVTPPATSTSGNPVNTSNPPEIPPAVPTTNTAGSSTVTTPPVTITAPENTNVQPSTPTPASEPQTATQANSQPDTVQPETAVNPPNIQTQVLQSSLFKDLEVDSDHYAAVSFLKKYKVLDGYPDGTFKPDAIVSRVESLKFVLNATSETLKTGVQLPFKDTSSTEWYSNYVATAYDKNIVKGYPDNTFKPANTVNKAEFLKMLIASMDFKVDKFVFRDVFNDVKADSWYAAYVKFAKDKNLIDVRGHYFKPTEGMTRAEVAELIYRAVVLKLSGAEEFSANLALDDAMLMNYFIRAA